MIGSAVASSRFRSDELFGDHLTTGEDGDAFAFEPSRALDRQDVVGERELKVFW